jgi:Fe-S-cluster-containing dehydrogenase component
VANNPGVTFDADGTDTDRAGKAPLKAFFVPKLCNHCEKTACTQVCPVGASYITKDGVVLVDNDRCIGCGYCVQACPYGSRFINKETHKADKCTLCYHRITKGLKPACVEVCPNGARIFGDLMDPKSDISLLLRERRYTLLKPDMGTHPKCYYLGLDVEVR